MKNGKIKMPNNNQETDSVRCINCLFFEKDNGFCRRMPPYAVYSGKKENDQTGYITTFAKASFPIIKKPELDWCGEFVHYSEG